MRILMQGSESKISQIESSSASVVPKLENLTDENELLLSDRPESECQKKSLLIELFGTFRTNENLVQGWDRKASKQMFLYKCKITSRVLDVGNQSCSYCGNSVWMSEIYRKWQHFSEFLDFQDCYTRGITNKLSMQFSFTSRLHSVVKYFKELDSSSNWNLVSYNLNGTQY